MLSFLTFMAAVASAPAMTKPAIPVLPELSFADCEDKQIRERKFVELEAKPIGKLPDAYETAWTVYLVARIEKLGLPADERKALVDGVAASPEFIAITDLTENLLEKMSDEIDTIGIIESDESACKGLVIVIRHLPAIMANAGKKYELIDQWIEAEAKRRGISLD